MILRSCLYLIVATAIMFFDWCISKLETAVFLCMSLVFFEMRIFFFTQKYISVVVFECQIFDFHTDAKRTAKNLAMRCDTICANAMCRESGCSWRCDLHAFTFHYYHKWLWILNFIDTIHSLCRFLCILEARNYENDILFFIDHHVISLCLSVSLWW